MQNIDNIDIPEILENMTQEIKATIAPLNTDDIIMVGIHSGGYWVAEELYQKLNLSTTLSSLNISFYRDDFTRIGIHPEVKPSQLPTSLDGKHILLVDDVLYTGRTVRAALNEIFDYGRPASVIFCTLIDRGEHELPICANITGVHLSLQPGQQIKLSGPSPLTLNLVSTEK